MTAVQGRGLAVSFGTQRILDLVDIDVDEGEVVAVRGASGSGKSTLLAVLCGLRVPDSGELWLRGQRLDGRSDRQRSRARLQHCGLVFQSDEFLPELTLMENVTLPLRMSGRPARTEDYRSRCDRLFERLGIDGLGDRRVTEVSGGQLQRAAVARAVINDPAIVLADEPTGSLDDEAARSAMRLLIEVARASDTAVVVVTHDTSIASLSDTEYWMQEGRLRAARAEARPLG